MNPKYSGSIMLSGPPYEGNSIKDQVLSYPRPVLEEPSPEPEEEKE